MSDTVTPERASTEAELLRLWRDIERWIAALATSPLGHNVGEAGALTSTERLVAAQWLTIFEQEIDAVRRARNSVAHAAPLSDEELSEAVMYGRQLLSLLHAKLSESRRLSA